jgi:formamidopyrimidine-DNA glycosylase
MIIKIERRGKYLLIRMKNGTLIIHLGMSGSLRLIDKKVKLQPHDHVDILLNSEYVLRYNDPRRFGAILWTPGPPNLHPLIQSIGIEPLDEAFTGKYLQRIIVKHHSSIKSFLMNSKMIAGIGNIYAAEALFLAFIHPLTPAERLSQQQCVQLVQAIKSVLTNAIAAGGTTLKDYVNSEGKPGYFSQQLYVYGRADLPCKRCQQILQSLQIGQRNTVFCDNCQKV